MTGFGQPRRHLRRAASTNDTARDLALAGAPSGTVVTADEQTAGRGRRRRRWAAPPGKALLYSAVLRPLGREHRLLPLAVPLAVCEAVESLAPLECRVKWPNDVWVCDPPASRPADSGNRGDSDDGGGATPRGRKVAGVLLEARPPEWAVIGIGLNVAIEPEEFPGELRWPATSVGHGATTTTALAAVNESLSRWANADPAQVVSAFEARDALLGREVRWAEAGGEHASEGAGRAEGIDDDGNLVVAVAGGRRLALGAGEVQLVLEALR
jgi:BirA family biotin operon repressor/biotin-[acetyl-CoA-carboxylase] ligase